MSIRRLLIAITALPGATLCGCMGREAATTASAPVAATLPAGFTPEASVLDLMVEFIDPNADDLWASVATISTTRGIEERQPRTDEEWRLARRRALTLVEASNLLAIAGRPVARPGQQLGEAGGEGDYTPAQAQAEIDKDRASFTAFAAAMQVASLRLLASIDGRDIEAFLDAGGELDGACEACHRRFWYPDSPQLPAP